jgi:hypothetical protein
MYMDFSHRCGAFCISSAFLCSGTAYADHLSRLADPAGDYQLRRLLNPTPTKLDLEQQRKVVTYDSLEINQVDTALDENFERIQNMMFTRIHHLPPTGAGPAEVEDDGC